MKFVQPIRNERDIEKIKAYLKEKNIRDYVMFCIGIYTALRASDIRKLKVKDIRESTGKFKSHISIVEQKRNNKNNSSRKIMILPQLEKVLKPYIKDKNDEDYLVKSRKGENLAIQREMIYRIVKEAADECGVPEVGSHTMRKTFAYHYYKKTNDIAGLMKMLGHSAEYITLRYIGLEQDRIDDNMRQIKY
jgi:integrase